MPDHDMSVEEMARAGIRPADLPDYEPRPIVGSGGQQVGWDISDAEAQRIVDAMTERDAAHRTPQRPDALPMRRRTPPSKPLPPQPRRAEPLPIRFARQVLAMDPPPAPSDGTFENGEWLRLDVPVSRSIISKKCREFADAYGVKLRIRVDHVDADDPTSPLKPHLWCCILKPEEIDTPLGGTE